MKKLECIYLMNVALYLKLTDIPLFVQINHKTKEVCDGLRVNPIDDGCELDLALGIINSYFPKLETLYLKKQSFETLSFSLEAYAIPNVDLFRATGFVYSKLLEDCPVICKSINKAYIVGPNPSEMVLSNAESIRSDVSLISKISKLLQANKSTHKKLKRIYLDINLFRITKKTYIINIINSLSLDYQIILRINNYFGNKNEYVNLIKLCNSLNKSVIFKFKGYFDIEVCYGIDEILRNQDSWKNEMLVKKITKDNYPLQLVIGNNKFAKHIREFNTVQNVKIFATGGIVLPSSVKTIETNNQNNVIIKNWDELKQIESIIQYGYNINTPPHYKKIEHNKKTTTFEEKITKISKSIRTISNLFSMMALFLSILNIGAFSFNEHFYTMFPFLTISLMTYIYSSIAPIINIWSKQKSVLKRFSTSGFIFMITKNVFTIYFDENYFGSIYSKISFPIGFSILFVFLCLMAIQFSLQQDYLKRLICDNFPNNFHTLLNINNMLYDFIDNSIISDVLVFGGFLALLAYCSFMNLFTTYGSLFFSISILILTLFSCYFICLFL